MKPGDCESEVEKAVAVFHRLLSLSWEALVELALSTHQEPAEFLAGWAQANWEMVVEASVAQGGTVFIDPYGDGADCNDVGSRVWMPGVESTHVVSIVPRSGSRVWDVLDDGYVEFPEVGLPFDRFVTRDLDWYVERPPFDHVLTAAPGKECLFRRDDVRMRLTVRR